MTAVVSDLPRQIIYPWTIARGCAHLVNGTLSIGPRRCTHPPTPLNLRPLQRRSASVNLESAVPCSSS